MHSPKKTKTSLAIHTKLSMCRVIPHSMPYQEIRGGTGRRGGTEKSGSNSLFTQCRGLTPFRFHSEYNKHVLLNIQTDFTVVGL
ncbi:unnamed protein product, partial [Staurois parvus]